MIHLRLERRSGLPPYLQLVKQIRFAVRNGTLRPGMRLPAAREVVTSLAINPNTVFKAYAELEREGLVTSRPGQGTFVAATAPNPIDDQVQRKLGRALESWLSEALKADVEREAALAMFTQALDTAYVEGVA
ncbi:MAG: GntR family transcriptional regulator [Terriglobales bacterium]